MRVYDKIAAYYTSKVKEFGCTPFGVDWTCVATQEMRFVQLLKLCDFGSPFSLNDLGCGYGALAAFLHWRYGHVRWITWASMSPRKWSDAHGRNGTASTASASSRVAIAHALRIIRWPAAYSMFGWLCQTIAGNFFIRATLRELAMTSNRGFAVNFLDRAPCTRRVTPGLYTTSPEPWIKYCVNHIGADVELIKGYGMLEFSLLISAPT